MMQSALVEPAKVTAPRDCGRGVYIPDPEEIQVTFQVGLVGSDGVLLASDCLITGFVMESRLSASWSTRARQSGSGSKITVLDNKQRIAYCASGGNSSLAVASRYAKHFQEEGEGNTEQQLIAARDSVAKESHIADGELLIAQSIGGDAELWHMEIAHDTVSAPQRVRDRWCIGDTANSAIFFVQGYAPISASRRTLLPLESLKLLAAHMVLTAGKLNPAGVGGLEMVVCKPDGFHLVSEQEINLLTARSDALDREIRARLLS